MKPIARWTIGNCMPDGYKALQMSIDSFLNFYDVDVVICYNCSTDKLSNFKQYQLIDQSCFLNSVPAPTGVAWKLYPSRVDIQRHEICIDNDIIFNERIEKIDHFFNSDSTLLLEDNSRTYGRFEKYVPPNFQINSGIYGMPPGFSLQKSIDFYVGNSWEKNALGEHDKNETFDEQGIVALSLLSYKNYNIISKFEVSNCCYAIIPAKAYHFIGLNRWNHHKPFKEFAFQKILI